MHPIVPYARTAYAQGWAASGGPLTDRVIAGSVAAIELAIERADDPDVLEATLHIGHLEGVWAAIFDRRTELYNDQVAKVGKYWKSFATDVDLAALVKAIRGQAINAQETTNQSTIDAAIALILAALSALALGVKWWNLRTQVSAGVAAGEAEGYADALALVADQLGQVSFDFELAVDDYALDFLDQEELDAVVDEWLAQMLDLISRELGKKLAIMADSGATFEEMMSAAADILLAVSSRALVTVVSDYVHTAITNGIMVLYRMYGVGNIWWITAGDQTVCPICDQYEAESPYTLVDCPLPPEHVNCRCSLYTEDELPGSLITKYVD